MKLPSDRCVHSCGQLARVHIDVCIISRYTRDGFTVFWGTNYSSHQGNYSKNWSDKSSPNSGFFSGVGKISIPSNKYTRSIDICPTLWALGSTANHSVPSSLAYVFFNSMDTGFGPFPFFCVSDYTLSIERLLKLPGVPVYYSVLMEM